MPLNLNIFDPDHRFGATALARSRDPARQKQGIALLGGIDKRAELRAESEAKAREATQGVFLQILENGLKTGFAGTTNPQDTFRKVVDGATGGAFAGELPPVESLVGKEDEVKRVVEIVKAGGGKLDAGSMLDAARGAGVGALKIGKSEADKPLSPAGKQVFDRSRLVEEFGAGSEQVRAFDKAVSKETNGTEFERLISTMPEQAQNEARAARIKKLTGKDGGITITTDKDGNVVVTTQGAEAATSAMTGAQKGKREQEFLDKQAATRRLIRTTGRIRDKVNQDRRILTTEAALARIAGSLRAEAEAYLSGSGRGLENGVTPDSFPELAGKSAGFKTLAFTAALMYAGAMGLGKGRDLSEKDVRNAIEAIGASTSDPIQLFERLDEVDAIARQGMLDEGPRILGNRFDAQEFAHPPEMVDGVEATPEALGRIPEGELTPAQARKLLELLGSQ